MDSLEGLHIYHSTTEDNIRYHIGIIDYLQLYDIQKRMERFTKKFLRLNIRLDTSAQDPEHYANRFSNMMN
jgi:hypothetical protein